MDITFLLLVYVPIITRERQSVKIENGCASAEQCYANAECRIMLANATAMMTAMQSQLCFAYANRNYVPKGNANFATLHSAHKERDSILLSALVK
ncbi:MAG: hypothetical protein J6V69_03460 [Clostridia bacterium]|nr:hypothetical protein [Clostridia bacterium]